MTLTSLSRGHTAHLPDAAGGEAPGLAPGWADLYKARLAKPAASGAAEDGEAANSKNKGLPN
jgi:hypothetical protein